MSELTDALSLGTGLLLLAAGLLLGAAHYWTLWWGTRRLAAGAPALPLIGVQALRLLLIGAALMLAVREGALPLLLVALGIVLARLLLVPRLAGMP